MRISLRRVVHDTIFDVPGQLRYAWVNSIAGSIFIPRALRVFMYRAIGMKVGIASIFDHVTIAGRKVTIEDGVFINRGTYIEAVAPVTIGAGSQIGMRVMICTSDHPLGEDGVVSRKVQPKPVTIGRDVWIGAGVIVVPGTTVGDGSVIAAGAVVTKDCQAGWLYAGVPARPLRAVVREAALEAATAEAPSSDSDSQSNNDLAASS